MALLHSWCKRVGIPRVGSRGVRSGLPRRGAHRLSVTPSINNIHNYHSIQIATTSIDIPTIHTTSIDNYYHQSLYFGNHGQQLYHSLKPYQQQQQQRQASSSSSFSTTTTSSQYPISNTDIINYFNNLSPRKQLQLEQDIIHLFQQSILQSKNIQKDNEANKQNDLNIDISNWIRSISFPKQSSYHASSTLLSSLSSLSSKLVQQQQNDTSPVSSNNNSIIVTLTPSTMLHPHLPQIKHYIQQFIHFHILQHVLQSQIGHDDKDDTVRVVEKYGDFILDGDDMPCYHDFISGRSIPSLTTSAETTASTTATNDINLQIDVQISPPIPIPFTSTSTPTSTPTNDSSTTATTPQHDGIHVHTHSSGSSSNSSNSNSNSSGGGEVKRLGLEHVQHVLAVYSCKGGVGKSTIAVNLAYEMAQRGARVGLLDVDIYGPSLGVLVQPPPEQMKVKKSDMGPNMVHPIEYEGVKMLSLCFVSSKSGVPGSGSDGGAAVMRGPMAGRVVTQLLKGTDWGHLDCLILDMPPGTGDVQLTVCQEVELSGIVSVTTPSKLALEDAKKGLEMFTSMGIPTLGFVENMSYFECEGGGKHYPFGSSLQNSTKDNLQKHMGGVGQSDIVQFPISPHTNHANESGKPLCLGRPEEAKEELGIYEQLCQSICHNLVSLQYGQLELEKSIDSNDTVLIDNDEFSVSNLTISVNNERKEFSVRFFSEHGAKEIKIQGEKLRFWDPKTGTGEIGAPSTRNENVSGEGGDEGPSLERTRVSSTASIFPCQIYPKGNYGFSVRWADGASIIYSKLSIATAAGGKKVVN